MENGIRLDITFFTSYSGVSGKQIPGKARLGEEMPSNPEGLRKVYFNRTTFRSGQADPISSKHLLENENQSIVEETNLLLDWVFENYQQRGVVPDKFKLDVAGWIANLKDLENELQKERATYVVFSYPTTQEPMAVIRIYDGSPTRNFHLVSTPTKIPIEIEFPHLQLSDRIAGNHDIVELGRLAKSKETDATLKPILVSVAQYIYFFHYMTVNPLQRKGAEPALYVEASEAGSLLYKKLGFKVAFDPAVTGDADTYILRIGADDFLKKFYSSKYEFYQVKH
ncbi:MAG: hypothetical protein ACXVCY_08900 [Pseudobdellovibrionaceae bacterium]